MKKIYFALLGIAFFTACNEQLDTIDESGLKSGNVGMNKHLSVNFELIGSLDVGEMGAAEISAFDPLTKKLFVVNNTVDDDDVVLVNQIEVVDFSNPASPVKSDIIDISEGKVNSLHVNKGRLAAAVEADTKTDNGKIIVFQTDDYAVIAEIEVGALPDMVTFSPDGKYILSANEGEPNSEYTIDPAGTVSIINTLDNYSVKTLGFSGFEWQEDYLKRNGLRIFGPGATFGQDIEPEYIAVSQNSKKAWVTLQENNAIAEIDLTLQHIVKIMPLGFKNYNLEQNSIDASDKPKNTINFDTWPVNGMYLPDGIAVLSNNNVPFIFTANEGDTRDYDQFSEEKRVKDVILDPTAFPDGVNLKDDANLGRLKITSTIGDKDNDGDYDQLFSFGARSFSIWNGNTGKQIFDSGNDLDLQAVIENNYDDDRSDDKGSEPEGIETGRVGTKNLLFVGLERVDGVAVYDVSNPVKPKFLQWLDCGDAPEGLLFIPANESPSGKSILVVSSEGDGVITVFTTM